jgi:hypothetical protein
MTTQHLTSTNHPDQTRRTWADRSRQAIRRFDRYTLEVMNPGHPYRLGADRSA